MKRRDFMKATATAGLTVPTFGAMAASQLTEIPDEDDIHISGVVGVRNRTIRGRKIIFHSDGLLVVKEGAALEDCTLELSGPPAGECLVLIEHKTARVRGCLFAPGTYPLDVVVEIGC